MRDKVEEKQGEGKMKQGGQQSKQQPAAAASSRPPSASSSPSHEFSFTISLHQPATTTTTIPADHKAKAAPPNSFAIDLSPADEIFFHGHLLPLQILSHLPVSPRSSTNSLDSFTLPIRELLEDQNPNKSSITNKTKTKSKSNDRHVHDQIKQGRTCSKSKSLSFFGLSKWRKGCEVRTEKEDKDDERHNKRKLLRFDVSHVVKRYMRMFRPLLSFRGGKRGNNMQCHRQPYSSFSGNLSLRSGGKQDRLRSGRRGEFSAPASMRTSPTNSGLLLATGTLPTSASDSTMEELQAAIQAAIAHCKNSIAMEDNIKCKD